MAHMGIPYMSASGDDVDTPATRKFELLTFLSTTFLVIPGLAVAFVGAFGLAIWLFQMLYGPPGPPV